MKRSGSILATIRARALAAKIFEDLAASEGSTRPIRAEAATQRRRLDKMDIQNVFQITIFKVDGSKRREQDVIQLSASDYFVNWEPKLQALVTGPQNTKQFFKVFRTVSGVTDKEAGLHYKVEII